MVMAICFGSIRADDRSVTTSSEDNKERWLFEFDAASNKPLATRSRCGLGESGPWQKHKVDLVQSKPVPEICPVKHSLTY
jgi:hypothetical protein